MAEPTTTIAEAVVIVREALAHLKALEKAACTGRYYFGREAGQAFAVIEDALNVRADLEQPQSF
jgi:hypothetical protein